MNAPFDSSSQSLEKFAIGQPVSRKEDPVLLRGEGRYSDDLNLDGQVYLAMVRSHYAHGHLRGIDTSAALALPGVLAVITQADLTAAGLAALPGGMSAPTRMPPQTPLSTDRVRYVGEPVACVIAENPHLAKDAAELVVLDIDPLPAVTTASDALAPGAPVLHDSVPGNLGLDYHYGDSEKVAAAFAASAHVTTLSLRATAASSSARWSRARRSAPSAPGPAGIPCGWARRACSARATRWQSCSAWPTIGCAC